MHATSGWLDNAMSATHDTHAWDLDDMEAELVERRRKECRERGEALEREANARAYREYIQNMKG